MEFSLFGDTVSISSSISNFPQGDPIRVLKTNNMLKISNFSTTTPILDLNMSMDWVSESQLRGDSLNPLR